MLENLWRTRASKQTLLSQTTPTNQPTVITSTSSIKNEDDLFMISIANLVSEDVKLENNNTNLAIPIPANATISTGISFKYGIVFNAKTTKDGKDLMIDGKATLSLTDADMPATMIIHEEGIVINILFVKLVPRKNWTGD